MSPVLTVTREVHITRCISQCKQANQGGSQSKSLTQISINDFSVGIGGELPVPKEKQDMPAQDSKTKNKKL